MITALLIAFGFGIALLLVGALVWPVFEKRTGISAMGMYTATIMILAIVAAILVILIRAHKSLTACYL